jgi:hypothetical protein
MDDKSGDGQWRPQYMQHPSEQTSTYNPRAAPLPVSGIDASPVASYPLPTHDDQHTGGYEVNHHEPRLRNETDLTRLRPTGQDPAWLHPSSSSYRDGSGSPWTSSRQYEQDSVEWSSHTPQSSLFEHQPLIGPSMENHEHHDRASYLCALRPRTGEHTSSRHGAHEMGEGPDLVEQRNGPWSPMNTRIGLPAAGIATRANRVMTAAMDLDVGETSQDYFGQMNHTPAAVSSFGCDVECRMAFDNLGVLDYIYHANGPPVSFPSSPFAAPSAYAQNNCIEPRVEREVPEGSRWEDSRGQDNEAWHVDRLDPSLR